VDLLLHREDHYRKAEGGTPDNVLEVAVGKNKDGATGTVPLHFDEALQLVRDLDRQPPGPPTAGRDFLMRRPPGFCMTCFTEDAYAGRRSGRLCPSDDGPAEDGKLPLGWQREVFPPRYAGAASA
jgi:hypothetical protein